MTWDTSLDREFALKTGPSERGLKLRTLSDASNFLTSITVNPPADEGAGLLTVLLAEAARTGRPEDIAAATGLLERFLAGKHLI
jgi:hypothetical protein